MFAKIICQAFVLSIAFTLVAGQFRVVLLFTDSQCSSATNFFAYYGGSSCQAANCTLSNDGYYLTSECLESNPLASLPADFVLLTSYDSNNLSCTSKPQADYYFGAPVGACTETPGLATYKISGCAAQGNTTITSYKTLSDCGSNTNPTTEVCNPGDCCSFSQYDAKITCPVLAPVAVPVAAPVAVPATAPVATPVASTTPGASAPTKRSSSASNIAVGFLFVAAAVLVLA